MAWANRKVDRLIGRIIGAIVFPTVSLITWWALDNDPAIIFREASLMPDSVAPSGRVQTYYQVDVKRDCPLEIGRSTTDSSKIVWPATTISIPHMALGPGSISLSMTIPPDASDGSADITNTWRVACNPWQAVTAQWRWQAMPPLSVTVERD